MTSRGISRNANPRRSKVAEQNSVPRTLPKITVTTIPASSRITVPMIVIVTVPVQRPVQKRTDECEREREAVAEAAEVDMDQFLNEPRTCRQPELSLEGPRDASRETGFGLPPVIVLSCIS